MSDCVIRCLVGMTGSGKTTKVESLVATSPRVLYYDVMGDYTDGVIVESPAELAAFWRKTCNGPFRIVYRPSDPVAEFGHICALVYALGNLVFVVDETDLYCLAGRCLDREFTILIGKGRHRDIDLFCCSQAPKAFANFLRSQAHEWFVFMLKEPDQVDYLVKRCSGLVRSESVLGLARFEYLHYRDYGPDGTPAVDKCMDDLTTGCTRFEPLSHASETVSDPGQHVVSGE